MRWIVAICVGILAAAANPTAALARFPLHGRMHFQMASANIYSDTANAQEDIRQAILKAGAERKHVLLVFGANWCVDCHLLDLYFHDPGNASLLAANYVLVNVNVGEYDRNLDLARKYGIPLSKGVPALVVLDGAGHVLYAQRHGEFENMRVLDSAAVTKFLQEWKPGVAHGRTRAHRSSK
ncbi:MAG: thioredoxin family protein [Acidobacteriaceae bacterium]